MNFININLELSATICHNSQKAIHMYQTIILFYYTMNFMQGQGLAKSRSHAHV